MHKASINLDDVYPLQTATSEQSEHAEHVQVKASSGEKSSTSITVTESHTVQENEVSAPPEPKSRTSVSHHSESKESHVESHRTSSFTNKTMDDDDLMASVFGVVKLPDVQYSQDHHHAIQHIDDALAGEDGDYHYDESSALSQHSSITSHRTANSSKVANNNASNRVAESLMQRTMDDLQLSSRDQLSNHYDEPPVDYDNGNGDYNDAPPVTYNAYESAPRLPSRRETNESIPDNARLRTMTYDSVISANESRVGSFDVHGEDGTETAGEINLHHDEVAYTRPEPQPQPVSEAPLPKIPPTSSGDTIKLRKLNQEIAEARSRQAELAAKVERERAAVEKLRLLKQQALAREAAARVHPRQHSIGGGVSVSGRSNSTTTTTTNTRNRKKDSIYSVDSIYEEEPAKKSPIAEQQLNNGKVVSTVRNVSLVVPQMTIVKGTTPDATIRKVIIGGEQEPTDEDKTILLFGPVKSGKTTTVNSMLNYLYDVKRENDFRFVLDTEITKTTAVTAYVMNNTVLPFSVTIVDTPGVVNVKNNMDVSTLIKKWFEQELLDAGTFRIDALSIVLASTEKMLGWPFINELAAVKHMLGDDLKTNVLPIITNSEVLPQPIAVRSLALANITFVEYYKINNIGFQPNVSDIPKLQHNLFFSHGMASLEAFFRDLQELIHPLLAVLRGAKPPSTVSSYPLYSDNADTENY